MARRLHDRLLAAAALLALWPVMLMAAIGIRLSSPGPVLHRARRAGLHGREFTLLKFRTMHQEEGSAITAAHDERVFPFGRWLRRTKIDELPQLVNVLRGEMAIVGPRPEDPRIVRDHYTPEQLRTLEVLPGLASPGSLYNYTHGEALLVGADAEARYLREVLPAKLALDLAYMRDASLVRDWRVIARTLVVIAAMLAGRRSRRRAAGQTRREPGNPRLEHGGG
jgi:lipopolysaccharide/colanic/teichoic acid biosynthesis glycosyltransferase